MRIQFSTTEATSSPQPLNGFWFEGRLGDPIDPPAPIDPPDNTGGGGTGNTPDPEEDPEEAGAGS